MTRATVQALFTVMFVGLACVAGSRADSRAALANADLIAFEGPGGLEVISPDGSGRRRLAPSAFFFVWSPDGSRIANYDESRASSELVILDRDGNEVRRLGSQCQRSVSWSPDGTRIACEYGDLKTSGIGVVRIADGRFTALTRTNDFAVDSEPVWSSDGSQIAFVHRIGEDWLLAVMKADGTGQKLLTRRGFVVRTPEWSPKRSRLAFEGKYGSYFDDDGWDIYLVSADGSKLTNLTQTASDDGEPHWSPNGRAIVFQSSIRGRPDIHTINANGTRHRNLTRSRKSDRDATWSPDGRSIVFASARDGNFDIYAMGSTGRDVRQLTNGSTGEGSLAPAWSP
jgi:TolB protein